MVEWVEVNPVPKVLCIHNSGGPRSLQTRVELGFKKNRLWPENAKSLDAAEEEVACATSGSRVRYLVWTESKSALFQYCVRSSASNFTSNFSGSFLCFGSSS
ncbi:hypothetical protein PIB30_080840 [Stylosanthes scabra]|uniref:Uncharacterized protein n=1 Tax=Stylosanthes scabra TaxID=79078 RepID=A0ABU6XPL6_9FABA|nr:hypothetical protein [Stylosanthes scabra]